MSRPFEGRGLGNCPGGPGWLGAGQVSWREPGSARGCLPQSWASGSPPPPTYARSCQAQAVPGLQGTGGLPHLGCHPKSPFLTSPPSHPGQPSASSCPAHSSGQVARQKANKHLSCWADLWEGAGVTVSYSTKGHLWLRKPCLGDQGHLKPVSRGRKSQPGKGGPRPRPHLRPSF